MDKTKVLFGKQIAREGKVRLGCSAIILDTISKKILLTQRSDNGQWCLPGGQIEAGESVSEACVREVFEETGLVVIITRLNGIYSDPNKLVVYPDGNKAHIIAISFDAEITGGVPGLSNETIAWGYFSLQDAEKLEMLPGHLERIRDSISGQAPVIK
ncbi:MAG: NUDIX domain-containing protein [Chloroflexi bacterium]|nr:NUDIX domain-containing protein [Chloroflexota bacterium]